MGQRCVPDCVVIGGGLIGMMSARELALAGLKVTIIERGNVGQESSWAGGGILSPLYPWRYPDAVTTLASWGQARYRALAEELLAQTGIDPEWQQSGLLMLAEQDQEAALDWSQKQRVTLEALHGEAISQCEPLAGMQDQCALWMPQVAQIRNPRLLRALRASLEALGVGFVEQTEVLSVKQGNGGVTGVETSQGLFQAGHVLIASGAWSNALLEGTGCSIAVEPVRGQMLLFKGEVGLFKTIVMAQGHYAIPRRDGHVLVGSTLEYVGFDKATTCSAAESLQQIAIQLVPALARCRLVRHWAGLRPGSSEGVPYIGEHPDVRGLYVNTGHFRNGVVLSLASARVFGDLLLGREAELDRSLYAIER